MHKTLYTQLKIKLLIIPLLCVAQLAVAAQPVELLSIESRSISGNKAQFLLEFSGKPPEPTGFSMDNPPSMIFDFGHAISKISKQDSSQKLVLGIVTGFNVIESASRT